MVGRGRRDEVSHFLDDSPTTGLAAYQVLRGFLGSVTMGRVGGRDRNSVSKRVSVFV